MKVIILLIAIGTLVFLCSCAPIFKAPGIIPENSYIFKDGFSLTFSEYEVKDVKDKLIDGLSKVGYEVQKVYFADVLIETSYLDISNENKKKLKKIYKIALRIEMKKQGEDVDINFSYSPVIAGKSDKKYYTSLNEQESRFIQQYLDKLKLRILDILKKD